MKFEVLVIIFDRTIVTTNFLNQYVYLSGSLLIDEMKLTKALAFNRKNLKVEGFTNLGEYTPQHVEGETRPCFGVPIPTFEGKCHQTPGCFLSKGSATGTILHKLIIECTTVGKKWGEFCHKMRNLYLFIQINFIPFKVIPSRYNALMPTFFPIVKTLLKFDFRNYLQSLFRFGLYLFNRVKTVSSKWSFEFGE